MTAPTEHDAALTDAIAREVADRIETMIRDSAAFRGIGAGELVCLFIADAATPISPQSSTVVIHPEPLEPPHTSPRQQQALPCQGTTDTKGQR